MDLSKHWNAENPDLRKGERTQLRILAASYKCIVKLGYYRTTFQTIADEAGVSQPLVVKIFKARENIFTTTAQAVLQAALLETEHRLEAQNPRSLKSALRCYFDVSIDMINKTPDLGRFYLNLHYLAAYEQPIREMNAAIRSNAVLRIEGLLSSYGQTRMSKKSRTALASSLHDLIVGHIFQSISLAKKADKVRVAFLLDKLLLEMKH
ncbi:MAG: TetR/AcrR family transcriptional regulator [Pseudomonadota bacterium]